MQFPRGFLKRAFEAVREKGGLCISDEASCEYIHVILHFVKLTSPVASCFQVQTGFGRMGSHYWGFETHDVMPDIGWRCNSEQSQTKPFCIYLHRLFFSDDGEGDWQWFSSCRCRHHATDRLHHGSGTALQHVRRQPAVVRSRM